MISRLNALIIVKQCLSLLLMRGCVWNKCEITSSLMSMKFNSEPVYGDNNKYINTKIKSQGDKVNTNLR